MREESFRTLLFFYRENMMKKITLLLPLLAAWSLFAANDPAMAVKVDNGVKLLVPAGFKLPLAEKDVMKLPGPAFTREFDVPQS